MPWSLGLATARSCEEVGEQAPLQPHLTGFSPGSPGEPGAVDGVVLVGIYLTVKNWKQRCVFFRGSFRVRRRCLGWVV